MVSQSDALFYIGRVFFFFAGSWKQKNQTRANKGYKLKLLMADSCRLSVSNSITASNEAEIKHQL